MKGQSPEEKARILALAGNPKNGQVQKLRSIPNAYRISTRKYFYRPDLKRGRDSLKVFGVVINGRFYTPEEYHRKYTVRGRLRPVLPKKGIQRPATAPSESAKAFETEANNGTLVQRMLGAVPVLYQTAVNIGLVEDLETAYGQEVTSEIMSLACHRILDRDSAACRFTQFARNYVLPFPGTLSEQNLADFYRQMGDDDAGLSRLFARRCARLPNGARVNYDSTSIPTTAADIALRDVSGKKEGTFGPMMRLSLLTDQQTGQPVLYRLFGGAVPDCSTVTDLLHCVEELVAPEKCWCLVFDRGYETVKNLAACAAAGKSVLMAVRNLRQGFIDRAIDAFSDFWDPSSCIPGTKVHGHTYKLPIPGQPRELTLWVHIFRDDAKSDTETAGLMAQLERYEKAWEQASGAQRAEMLNRSTAACFTVDDQGALQRRNDYINACSRHFGFFADVSTCEMTAAEALEIYHRRDGIEKCFKSGKLDVNLDVVRAHSQETMQGRFVVAFVTLAILTELNRQLGTEKAFPDGRRKTIPRHAYSLTDVLDYTHTITADYAMNTEESWCLGQTAGTARLCEACGTPGVYDGLPRYLTTAADICAK